MYVMAWTFLYMQTEKSSSEREGGAKWADKSHIIVELHHCICEILVIPLNVE